MKIDNMVTNNKIYWPVQVILLVGIVCALSWWSSAASRYPVGQPVASSVYTEPFDPCDPAYKFLQAPPKDWAEKFGANERTMLIHAVSELRVVVAAQGRRLLALEDWQKKQGIFDPNAIAPDDVQVAMPKDANEAKR